MNELFRKFSHKASEAMGSSWAFLLAFLTIIIWVVSGPIFHYSETWQLVINTGTTIVTFLMVFLVQNTQNRDTKATQLKLDELIHAAGKARNKLIDAEEMSDDELEAYKEALEKISRRRVIKKKKK